MNNKDHLIPAPIKDIGQQLSEQNMNPHLRETLIGRLEVCRDYCDELLTKYNGNSMMQEAKAFKRRNR
jgi:hypothetical protein